MSSSWAGASGSTASYTLARARPSERSATSWDASRSRYRATGRASPKKRTPTIAAVSESTAGCSAALEIRYPAVPIRPTPKRIVRTPRSAASASRARRTSVTSISLRIVAVIGPRPGPAFGPCRRSSRTTRSACSTSSGLCAIRSTMRPVAQPLDRLCDDARARAVEVGRRLVQNHERRAAHERPGQRDAPALARRQRAAPVADERLVAERQRLDEPVGAREHGCVANRAHGRARVAEPDVVGDRPAEDRRPLRHPGDAARARGRVRQCGEVEAADGDAAVRPGRRSPGAGLRRSILPEPLGPTSATVSSGCSSRSSPSSTRPGRDG